MLLSLAAGLLIAVAARPVQANHGLVPVARQTAGPYEVAVFTEPRRPRVGAVEVSVLVQRAGTTTPVDDARVAVTAAPAGASDRTARVIRVEATRARATNKLFYAARLEVPAEGRWRLGVDVQGAAGAASVRFDVEVEPSGLLDRPLLPVASIGIATVMLLWWLSRPRRARPAGRR